VKVSYEGGEIECVTRNISLGGMYLLTGAVVPYGTKVRLTFQLPSLRESASLDAVVRWQKDDGVGVQFGSLRAREVWALNQLFKDSPVDRS
jgi:hypothetical protein